MTIINVGEHIVMVEVFSAEIGISTSWTEPSAPSTTWTEVSNPTTSWNEVISPTGD